MNAILLFGVLVLSFLSVRAQEIPILDGAKPSKVWSLEEIASQVQPGQIIVMGEKHGLKTAQQSQIELMKALRAKGLKVSVSLEFINYLDQPKVDLYRQGQLTESEFLQQIQWGQPPFSFYREQALFPQLSEGSKTLALNAPRSLTGKIAKQGIDSLTAPERALLPPNFEMGKDSYRKRFIAQTDHWPTPEAAERYFTAQSVWDDTMAWKAAEFLKQYPDQVLLMGVGDFHAMYMDGLPARLFARTGQKALVFSHVNTAGLTPEEVQAEIQPSPIDGPRADFIWLTSEAWPSQD